MQRDQPTHPPIRRPPRLIRDPGLREYTRPVNDAFDVATQPNVATQPTLSQPLISIEQMHATCVSHHRPQGLNDGASGKFALLDVSEQATMYYATEWHDAGCAYSTLRRCSSSTFPRDTAKVTGRMPLIWEEGWWPNGIQQTGPLPIVNLYGSEPFGKTLPLTATPPLPAISEPIRQASAWRALLSKPAVKVTIGLAVGIGLLFLVARYVDIPSTVQELRDNLAANALRYHPCPPGGFSFVTSLAIRGVRWGLFLRPIARIKTVKVIQIFMIGTFLNFLLPIRGGEVAKSLILKKTANIPVSQSLPTVAMDKALDLMPALFIIAIVPFLGVKMSFEIWLILGSGQWHPVWSRFRRRSRGMETFYC